MDRVRFEFLLERYSDGLATAQEIEEFTALLKQHAEFRKILVERNSLEVLLHDVIATQATAERPSVRIQATRRVKRKAQRQNSWLLPMGIAAAVMLVAGVIALQSGVSRANSAQAFAQIKLSSGARIVRGPGGPLEPKSDVLYSHDTVFTSESGTSEFIFNDGTRVTIHANSQVNSGELNGNKWVQVESGEVSASVRKQPDGKPMLFNSVDAQAMVVGTELRFAKRGAETRLEVSEGLVMMSRLSDGKTVEVKAGQAAVAAAGKEFVAEAITAAITEPIQVESDPILVALGAPVLNENFENGQADGWIQAKVTPGGAEGSRFALEATFRPEQSAAIIFSAVKLPTSRLQSGSRKNEWVLEYRPEYVLQFSYFLEGPAGAIRVQGFNNEQDDNFNAVVEKPVLGRWTTVQVRLDAFRHNDSKRAAETLQPGTHFRSLQFYPPGSPGNAAKFLIDNIVVAPAAQPDRK